MGVEVKFTHLQIAKDDKYYNRVLEVNGLASPAGRTRECCYSEIKL